MKKYIITFLACLALGGLANAKTTFLPDWFDKDLETPRVNHNIDEPRCIEAVDSYGNHLYHKATGCPAPKIFDEYCPFDDEYISECYCPSVFGETCSSPYRGDPRVRDPNSGYANCDDLWVACCDGRCPSGTTKTDPGGCGGSTINDCGDTCYYPYVECCTPLADETGCRYGTEECSDGCDGTRTCCKACEPLADETGCEYGTVSCSDGCGGTRNCCGECSPLDNETNCECGTESCLDGCGGTRTCCTACPVCVDGGSETCSGESSETACAYGSSGTCTDCSGDTKYICNSAPSCTPLTDETGCEYGTKSCDNGCGGTRVCCNTCADNGGSSSCSGESSESDCTYGSSGTCTDCYGNTKYICNSSPSCTPLADETGCSYGTKSCSDGCGGTRVCCNTCADNGGSSSCSGVSSESACSYGSSGTCKDCYGNTKYICNSAPACTPYADETGCEYGPKECSDGCDGTRTCCKTCADNGGSSSCSGESSSSSCRYGVESTCKDCYGNTKYVCDECSNTCSSGSTSSSCTSPKTASVVGTTECGNSCYSCECPSSYKYTCSGTGYSGGSGTACDGKYTSCVCSSGYSWNGSACEKNSCTVKTCSHATKQTGGAWSCSACTATFSDCSTSSQWNCDYDECRITSCPTNASCSSDVNGKNPKCTCGSGFLPYPQNGTCVCDTATYSRSCQYDVILHEDLYNYLLMTSYGYKIMHSSPCAYCVKSCTSSDSGCSYGV